MVISRPFETVLHALEVSAYAEMRQERDAARARITQLENATRLH
jgi:hypothetical protein